MPQRSQFIVSNKGFSLAEIIVVIALIGTILAIALPRMANKKQETSLTFRTLATNVKQIRNRAKLYGTTYRLAIKMDPNAQSYWVEKSSNVTLIDKKMLDEQHEKAKSQFKDAVKDEEKSPAAFTPDTTFFKKEQVLPAGFTFKLVESGSTDSTYSEGTAYIHFFPQGYIEPCLIQISDAKKNIWTLVFNPITGQADVIAEAKTLKELSR